MRGFVVGSLHNQALGVVAAGLLVIAGPVWLAAPGAEIVAPESVAGTPADVAVSLDSAAFSVGLAGSPW